MPETPITLPDFSRPPFAGAPEARFEPLPADLMALVAGQPQSRNLQITDWNELLLSRPMEMHGGQ